MPKSRETLLEVLGLLLLAVIPYFPALSAGFVWDDVTFTSSPLMHDWQGLRTIWADPTAIRGEEHYWPVVYSVLWLERQFFGLSAAGALGYHLVSVLLHTANAFLVFAVLRAAGSSGAWLAAAVFAVHPVHVESVAWLIELKDVLSAFFYLSSFALWQHWRSRGRPVLYAVALLAFALGMLTKSIVISLPFALALFAWWREGTVSKREVFRLLPFLGIGLAVLFLDLRVMGAVGLGAPEFSPVGKVLIASRAFWFYLGKLLWPSPLMLIHPRWLVDPYAVWQYLYVAATVLLFVVLWLCRRRIGIGPLAAMLFYGITLGPILGLVSFSYMQYSFVADRFQYLASIGPIVLVAEALGRCARNYEPGGSRPMHWTTPPVSLLLLVLCFLTWGHARHFRSSTTVFQHNVHLNPEAWVVRYNLALALCDEGRFHEALPHFARAAALKPDQARGRMWYGVVLAKSGQRQEARRELEESLRLAPGNRQATEYLRKLEAGLDL